MEFEQLINEYKDVKSGLEEIKQEQKIQDRIRETHEKNIERLSLSLKEKEIQLEILESSLKVFQNISDDRNKSAKESLEKVINWALSKVFIDQMYTIKIEEQPDARSGKIMKIYLIDSHTGKTRTLKNQTGTALSQIVSFLMMLTTIKFAGSSKVLLLDELFSGLEDKEAVLMFSDILTSLAENDGFQGIVVEQNSLISDNEKFIRMNVALDDPDEGLELKSVHRLKNDEMEESAN